MLPVPTCDPLDVRDGIDVSAARPVGGQDSDDDVEEFNLDQNEPSTQSEPEDYKEAVSLLEMDASSRADPRAQEEIDEIDEEQANETSGDGNSLPASESNLVWQRLSDSHTDTT